jgi:hypothetical protein
MAPNHLWLSTRPFASECRLCVIIFFPSQSTPLTSFQPVVLPIFWYSRECILISSFVRNKSSPIVLERFTTIIFVVVDPQAMGVGQMFGEHLYTIMSNAGVLIFVITILQLMNEVDKDMVANDEVAFFLVQVARKGDEIRVSLSPRTEERGHSPGEDEEKSEDLAVCSGCDTNNVHFDPQHD